MRLLLLFMLVFMTGCPPTECVRDGDCRPSEPVCIDYRCMQCNDDYDCPDQERCWTDADSYGHCVDCLDNSHCSAPTPYCLDNTEDDYDLKRKQCVECRDSNDCPVSGEYCNTYDTWTCQ